MPNIAMGESHFDFLFINDALSSDEDHFSNLRNVESRYLFRRRSVEGYCSRLHEADSKIDWRYRVARWMLRVADDFLLRRDTAVIALNYLDRLMMNQSELLDRDQFQVSAIACLFVASKIYQKRPLKIRQLVTYTKNAFQSEDILAMEQELLRSHSSFFFPPTSSTFCSVLLSGIMSEPPAAVASVIESCQFMSELAACDTFFVAHRASSIAVAAIVVTFEINSQISQDAVARCLANIKAKIDYTTDADVLACIDKLRSVHNHNAQRIKDMEEKSADDEVAKYTTDKEAYPNLSPRTATPSPTDPCQHNSDTTSSPPIIADKGAYSSESRKRQRRL